ncbi:MAG: methionine aminotransferase [Acidobacteria bacterium]|nr:methionine aminotransferase [Acidobacteriota bacterium]
MPELFPGRLQPKLPHVGTTIFAVMSRLAAEHGAINLSQGFPDFPIADGLIERVRHYMKKGFNQYAPMSGMQTLREVISEKVESLYGACFHPEREINITAGATQGLFTAIQSVVQKGDEVIVFPPAYDSYVPAVLLNGAVPVFIDLEPPDFRIDWKKVRAAVTEKTRMIVLNTPHNPTGSVLSETDIDQLREVVRGTDIICLSDEVYEHIIFDGRPHQSILRHPDLTERSFAVFSFGKTFHATGWKTGYVLAPENLMAEFRSVHQFTVYCCNTPIQLALADFLRDKDNHTGIPDFYQSKRDFFLDLIQTSRFKGRPAEGSYFQILDYSAVTDEKDTDFAVRMTREYGVASIPVSVFYDRPVDNHVLRFCFAKQKETLDRAAEILCAI